MSDETQSTLLLTTTINDTALDPSRFRKRSPSHLNASERALGGDRHTSEGSLGYHLSEPGHPSLSILPRFLTTVYGQTCRVAYSALSCKHLWARIFHRIQHERDFFDLPFDPDALSPAQIQRAALGEFLWKKRVRGCSADVIEHATTMEPVSITTIPGYFSDGFSYRTSFLLPGGRFFLTISGREGLYGVDMWDLGIPGASPSTTLTNIAQVRCSHWIQLIACDATPGQVRIAMLVDTNCAKYVEQTRRQNIHLIMTQDCSV